MHHSMSTGARAKQIATLQDAHRKLCDECFVSGMLHDTGRLVLVSNLTDQYCRVVQLAREKQIELHEAEQQVFNTSHAEVGGYLLGLWGLPVPVVETITFHHCPSLSASKTFSPLTAVHVANALVQEQYVVCEGVLPPPLDLEYLHLLNLSERLNDWREAIHETVSQGETR